MMVIEKKMVCSLNDPMGFGVFKGLEPLLKHGDRAEKILISYNDQFLLLTPF